MESISISVYIKGKKEICKMDLENALQCELASLDIWDEMKNSEVAKALAVLKRSQLIKEVKNSRYAVYSKKNLEIDEDAMKNLEEGQRQMIVTAVSDTKGIIGVSGGRSVELFFTQCCGGGTANSEDILGYRINYLRKVLCKYCSQDSTERIVSINEAARKLNLKGLSYKEQIAGIFREIERDDTGRIININFLGKVMTGEEFAKFFGIKGNRVYFMEDSIVFKSIGNGMGLGICLEGAEMIARQGGDYSDIIKYYYTGVEFEVLDEEAIKKTLKDKNIILDPGHGGNDTGNTLGEIAEKDVNLIIARVLEKRLGEIGARVILTRFKDENIPMGDRVSLINAAKPEMFISIHQNSFMIPGINGVEVYCYGKDAEAMRFGTILCENISRMAGIKNRGVRTGDYYLLRECRVSGVIIECMYMSGDKDGTKYNDETYEAIAGAIYESICSYYDIEP